LIELDPQSPDLAFALCDLGHGFPELGYLSLAEVSAIRGRLGCPVERDIYFKPRFPLSVYVEAARQVGRITDADYLLVRIARDLSLTLSEKP